MAKVIMNIGVCIEFETIENEHQTKEQIIQEFANSFVNAGANIIEPRFVKNDSIKLLDVGYQLEK